jgi:serine/threonine-protein kinase RsbT
MIANKKEETAQICEQSINQEWHIALSKSKATLALKDYALTPLQQAEILTIISELGYNLFFHANLGGVLRLRATLYNYQPGIIIESIDSGPGIISIESCMKDGFSTNGGLGGGLPGVKRLSDEFEISQLDGGTWVRCVKWLNK